MHRTPGTPQAVAEVPDLPRGRRLALALMAPLLVLGCQSLEIFFLEPDRYPEAQELKGLMKNLFSVTGNAKRDYNDRDWANFRANIDHLVTFSRELSFYSPTFPSQRGELDALAWERFQERLHLATMELVEDVRSHSEGIYWENAENREKVYYPGFVESHFEDLVQACNDCHVEFGVNRRIEADTKADAGASRRPLRTEDAGAAAPSSRPAAP